MNYITLILLLLPDLLSRPICSSLHAVSDSVSSSLLMCCDSFAFCVATACKSASACVRACVGARASVYVFVSARTRVCFCVVIICEHLCNVRRIFECMDGMIIILHYYNLRCISSRCWFKCCSAWFCDIIYFCTCIHVVCETHLARGRLCDLQLSVTSVIFTDHQPCSLSWSSEAVWESRWPSWASL